MRILCVAPKNLPQPTSGPGVPEGEKIEGASSTVVGIICPPLVGIGLTELQNPWHPRFQHPCCESAVVYLALV